jgi:cytochrome c oxidase cbb3-type subunit 3
VSKQREIDEFTGVETTGHQWDGIKELNKPLPRWWLLTFYATIVWAIGYWIAFPAWPTLSSYSKGVLGYSQRATVAGEVKAATQSQAGMRDLLAKTALADIKKNPELLRFANTGGAAAFQTNCGPCHGRGAQGAVGYPNLNDDDWLWGGKIEDIEHTILYGVRSDDAKARASQMPRYGLDKLLTDAQISDVADYVLTLSGGKADATAAGRGAVIFKEQCASCHGENGKGMAEQGAPNLTDGITLYGGNREAIVASIQTGRGGMMPAWAGRLDAATVKSLASYVHTLGGGK